MQEEGNRDPYLRQDGGGRRKLVLGSEDLGFEQDSVLVIAPSNVPIYDLGPKPQKGIMIKWSLGFANALKEAAENHCPVNVSPQSLPSFSEYST